MAYANAGNVTPATSTHNRGLALDIGEKNNVALNNLIIDACKEAGFTGVLYHARHVHANLNPKVTTLPVIAPTTPGPVISTITPESTTDISPEEVTGLPTSTITQYLENL